jgi:hypothetical protein
VKLVETALNPEFSRFGVKLGRVRIEGKPQVGPGTSLQNRQALIAIFCKTPRCIFLASTLDASDLMARVNDKSFEASKNSDRFSIQSIDMANETGIIVSGTGRFKPVYSELRHPRSWTAIA